MEIAWFDRHDPALEPVLGGKNTSLGIMTMAGLPVPPGFAITAAAYRRALAETGVESTLARMVTDLERKGHRFLDADRLKVMSEIQDAQIETEGARDRLRVARLKIDKAKARDVMATVPDMEIRIFRDGDATGIVVDESAPLKSGDVVEIRSGRDRAPAPPRSPVSNAQ